MLLSVYLGYSLNDCETSKKFCKDIRLGNYNIRQLLLKGR